MLQLQLLQLHLLCKGMWGHVPGIMCVVRLQLPQHWTLVCCGVFREQSWRLHPMQCTTQRLHPRLWTQLIRGASHMRRQLSTQPVCPGVWWRQPWNMYPLCEHCHSGVLLVQL